MAEQKHRRGRGPVYKWEFAAQAGKLAALGATYQDLADFFDVTLRAIHIWNKQRSDFYQAVQAGRTRAKERVEHSLYRRALGYTVETVKATFPDGGRTPVLVPYLEHVPPDPRAAEIWLKKQFPRAWSRRREGAQTHRTASEAEPTVIILPHNGRD